MTYNRVRFYGIWPFFNLRYAGNVLELAFCHFAPKVGDIYAQYQSERDLLSRLMATTLALSIKEMVSIVKSH